MVATRRKPLGQQLSATYLPKLVPFILSGENFRLTPEVKEKFTEKLRLQPQDFFGHTVKEIVRTDGLKLVFEDGAWVCYRLSGTEPVVRVYSEAGSEADLQKLSAAAKRWIFE